MKSSLAGLRALRSRLRLPHFGQCLPGASARHKDFQEGPASRHAHRQDERAHQEDHHAGAEGAVWHEEGLRRVARGVAGTTARGLQVPVRTMELSAVLSAVCIVVVLVIEFRRAATNRPDSQRAGAAIRPGTPGPRSRALHATSSRVGPEKKSLRFVEDTFLPSNYANLTVPNKQTNYRISTR